MDVVRQRHHASKPTIYGLVCAVILAAAITTPITAAAQSNIGVYVAYADSLRANASNFPTPWLGSPQTTFEGCIPAPSLPCEYDGAAIRVVNNSGSPVTVEAITLHIDTCTYTGWPSAALAPGADLIVTQMLSGAADGCTGPTPNWIDSSDIGPGGSGYSSNCTPDGIQPVVDVTVNGVTTSYTDSGQVLNTGGIDAANCPVPGASNESIQWTVIGHAPCKGSILSLTPPTQTHVVGTTASLTATFTNSCNQPLSNVAVNFAAQSGPNAGQAGSGVTDANGQATISYTSSVIGTDSWNAFVDNLAGRINSNAATVMWVALAAGAGAFVIGDNEINDGSVYWWGAQWWKKDPLSTGLAPASFKGYENSNLLPWCGQTWTTRPGNSPHPPATVPSTMAVIVASHITKNGPVISGDIVAIVLVHTNPGYRPNPGHPGTGTIVDTLCHSPQASTAGSQIQTKPAAPSAVKSLGKPAGKPAPAGQPAASTQPAAGSPASGSAASGRKAQAPGQIRKHR